MLEKLSINASAVSQGALESHRGIQRTEESAVPITPLESKQFFLINHGWAFIVFLFVYTVPGLIGHQPWKQDETYIVEIVRSMLATGDFVVPTMAGEAFMEKPPLFYWVAGGFAKLLSPGLAFHDAARIATACFVLLTCAAMARCGRRWRDRDFGRTAVLVLLACLGMQTYSHLMLTDITLMAGIAVGFAGLPGWHDHPVRSGLEIGTGIGIGFLAKGLLAPGLFAVSALMLPICFKRWRQARYVRAVLVAAAAALPWILVWPTALFLRSASLFSDWFWLNNIGRFLGFAVPSLGAAHDTGFWSKNLWWITLPAAPLAVLTAWRARHTMRANQMMQAAVVFTAVIMSVLLLSASARGGYALPLLVPLSLLAADSARSLSSNVERLWLWTARLGFSGLGVLIWFAWTWIMFGKPAHTLHFIRDQLAPDLDRHVNVPSVLISIIATFAMFGLMWHPIRQCALQTWVVGLALCWLLLANLFLPWVDQVKSYKAVFESMQAAVPANVDCVASYGLGESERAMLSYYHGIITRRLELEPNRQCRVVLVEGLRMRPPEAVDRRLWKKIWEGARPADTREHFWLYERQ